MFRIGWLFKKISYINPMESSVLKSTAADLSLKSDPAFGRFCNYLHLNRPP